MQNFTNTWFKFKYQVKWDSLFTGIPAEVAYILQKYPEFSKDFQLKNHSPSSILNLKELEHLELIADTENRETLFSDLAFHFAFLAMRKLKTLRFFGCFDVCHKMARAWRDRGGILFQEEDEEGEETDGEEEVKVEEEENL